ncbi:MAG: MFS transporter, partial [Brooklawnia sp.]
MTQPIPTESSPRGQRALTVTLLGGALAIAFEAYGTLTAMPAAADDLGRVDLYAWAFTGFVIGQVLAIVLAGRLVDRIGPVAPLAAGVGVFIVGLLGAGFAPSMEALLVSRFVQGVGGGATNLAFMVVVAQTYGKQERAWLMSLLSLCW